MEASAGRLLHVRPQFGEFLCGNDYQNGSMTRATVGGLPEFEIVLEI